MLVQGKSIQEVGFKNRVHIPKNAEVIDLAGSYLLPGLIDAHLHLTGFRTGDMVKESLLTPYEVLVARVIKDLDALIKAGFTTVGDAGGAIAVNIKKAVEEGTITGPRISAAGYKKNKPESTFHLWDCDEWLKLV